MSTIKIDIKIKEQGKLWLLPPYNYSLRQIAKELNVGAATVSGWRRELVTEGKIKEEVTMKNNNFSAEQIFGFVLETATMSETEIAEYCGKKGLFVEQFKEWRIASIKAHEPKQVVKNDSENRLNKKKIKQLEKELARKGKALAETAALLVLREKFNALWDNSEDD